MYRRYNLNVKIRSKESDWTVDHLRAGERIIMLRKVVLVSLRMQLEELKSSALPRVIIFNIFQWSAVPTSDDLPVIES